MSSNYNKKFDQVDEMANTLNSCIKELLQLSNDQDENVRYNALESLEFVRTPEVEDRMREGLKDKDELVRVSCVEILGSWQDKSSSKMIIKSLSDKSSLVRAKAAIALADIGETESISIIKEKIRKADDEEKNRYYFALFMLGEQEYFSNCLNGLYHEFYRIRCATANLITFITTDSNREFILNLLKTALENEETVAAKSSIETTIQELTDSGK